MNVLRNDAADESGFSLVEVMVALFIFAIISTATAYTMLSVIHLSRDSRARHVAANLAAEEIDLAQDAADLLTLVDAERAPQQVGTDTFHVTVSTEWVTSTGSDDACGAGTGTLRYKRVNVEVRWDNQRDGSTPVRADTLITPDSHLNDAGLGTVLVRVAKADGSGASGVVVSVVPAATPNGATSRGSATTDAQGCAFLLRLVPGTYAVTASAAGYIDSLAQAVTPKVTVAVVAGLSAGASFSYDRASSITLSYASNAPATDPAPTVYLPNNLDTTFLTATGDSFVTSLTGPLSVTNTTRSRVATLFPFSSGYQVLAGRYVAAVSGSTAVSCLAVDPLEWAPVTAAGVTRVGIREDPLATTPGEGDTGNVPMGIVTLSGVTATASLTAVSATGAAGSGDPGCARTPTYIFGAVAAGATIALPYGSWTLSSGGTAVSASRLTIVSGGTKAGNVITLDPRQVAP